MVKNLLLLLWGGGWLCKLLYLPVYVCVCGRCLSCHCTARRLPPHGFQKLRQTCHISRLLYPPNRLIGPSQPPPLFFTVEPLYPFPSLISISLVFWRIVVCLVKVPQLIFVIVSLIWCLSVLCIFCKPEFRFWDLIQFGLVCLIKKMWTCCVASADVTVPGLVAVMLFTRDNLCLCTCLSLKWVCSLVLSVFHPSQTPPYIIRVWRDCSVPKNTYYSIY